MSNTPITTCTGVFYDSGGFVAAYGDNENLSTTICSDGSSGTHISLLFNEFDVSPGDLLCFYDGAGTSAPQISCILDFGLEPPFVVQSSANNTSGCLTVTFTSNSANVGAGWSAAISCTDACQRVIAQLDNTTPAAVPSTNGWIDVCPGDQVQFSASGVYPDNGMIYNQSDNTSSFTWDFGDGSNGTGRNITHQFTEPGGYIVQLILEDINGCTNANFIEQRVRVAPAPTIEIVGDIPTQLCENELFTVNSNLDFTTADIQVTTAAESFSTEPSHSDTLFVPDGLDEYQTAIQITDFTPGQVLTDINDLGQICLNMEHSYLFDLDITITCPSGNSITLLNHEGFIPHKINLGEPVQNMDDPCSNTNTAPGIGYQYCFSQLTGNGTMTAAGLGLDDGDTLPEGVYDSYEPLSGLIGCPLNGIWTISVSDNLACDNGWIFSWQINFAEDLFPAPETFMPAIESWQWVDDINITSSTANVMNSAPDAAGIATYLFEVQDEFGCVHPTTFDVNVLPNTHPTCFTCTGNIGDITNTMICEGETVDFDATFDSPIVFEQSFRATPKETITSSIHTSASPYESTVNVTNLFSTTINNATTDIAAVCVNMQTPATGDITMVLQAPSGEQLTLISEEGGTGDNFVNTCFKPTAIGQTSTAAAPFTGDFRAEGLWSGLNGANIMGFWTLRISDNAGNDLGYFEDWTITFNVQNELTYTWTNSASLSCDDCPTPTASPETTTTYTVEMTDLFGCTLTDEATVTVVEILDDIDLVISDMNNGTVFYEWDVTNAAGYQVNINNTGWVDVGNVTSGEATGFVEDDPISIQIQPYTAPLACNHPISEVTDLYSNCFLAVNEGLMTNPTCTGIEDGVVSIDVLNGEAPFEYSINGSSFQDISIFQNLPAGNYTLVAMDNRTCIDSVQITLIDPEPIAIQTSSTMVSCFDGTDGILLAEATGGTGTLMYGWDVINGTMAEVENVAAGDYEVIVTDANNCTATASETLAEPTELLANVQTTDASCYGGADGGASVLVGGGTPNYAYEWSEGNSNNAMVADLTANTYFVTVTDANACTAIGFVQIAQPAPAQAMVTPTDESCVGANDGLAIVNDAGQAPFNYIWSDTDNQMTQTAENLSPGSYSVSMTDVNGCLSIGVTIIGSPLPINVDVVPTGTACVGTADGAATVVADGGTGIYTFAWNDSDSQTSNPAINLSPTDYEVTVTDSNNCTATSSVTIPEATPISLTVDSTFTSCVTNTDGSVSVMAMGGTGVYDYVWNDTANQTNNSAVNLGNGAYEVTVTDSNNCTATANASVITNDPILLDTIVMDMVLCAGGNTGSAMVFATGGNGAYTYTWSDMNMQLGNPVNNLTAGTYTVTVADQSNCTVVESIEITEPTALGLSLSAEMIACFGDNVGSATALPTGGTQPYTYTWDDVNNQTDSIAMGLSGGIYNLTLMDANGCTITESVEITQPTAPLTAILNQTHIGCFGENQSEATLNINGGTGLNYNITWSSNQNTANATNLEAGWQYVSVTDANNCMLIDSIDIQELAIIDANLAFAQPTCYAYVDGQAAVNFIEGGAGGSALSNYEYEWSTSPMQTGPVASGLAGNQQYLVTITDSQACQTIDSVMVTQPMLIELVTQETDISCFGFENGSLEIVEVIANTDTFEYAWSANTGVQSGPFVENLDVGTYTVTVTDEDGCNIATSLFITEPNPITVNLDSLDNPCFGEDEGMASANVFGGISPYAYAWSNGVGTNPIEELNAGMYYVTVEDANGCLEQDSIQINDPIPLVGMTQIEDLDCVGDRDATIFLFGTGGSMPYTYSFGDNSLGETPSVSNLVAGDYIVGITDGLGCEWDSLVTIAEPDAFDLDLTTNVVIQTGDRVELEVNYTNATGVPEFEWSSLEEETLSCMLCPNPVVDPLNTTIYEVYAVDESGCEDTDFIRVIVERNAEVLVPTGFTPNGDNKNDLLHVHGKTKSIEQVNLFRVFDRWGELVYEQKAFGLNDMNIGWDGRLHGKEMPTGVYVWYLEVLFIDGGTKHYEGNTTLIR